MQDTALYEAVLGLEAPWKVTEVKLDTPGSKVEVWVEGERKRWPCPECGVVCPQHDTRFRRWRHLDTCQFQAILCASVPRVKCLKHGVKQVPVPWAEANSKFTAMFEARVLRWLQEASISAVAELPRPCSTLAASRSRLLLGPRCSALRLSPPIRAANGYCGLC